MKYTTIYEAKSFYGVSIPFVILILLFIVLLINGIIICRKKQNSKIRIVEKLGPFVIDLVILIIIASMAFSMIDSRINVYNKYICGKYSEVNGVIENYEEIKGISNEIKYDQFEVDGSVFYVPGETTCWGYPLKKCDGGILRNNTKVKICYVSYKYENIIMKLEVLKNN